MKQNRQEQASPRRKRRRRPGKFRRALHALGRAVLLLLLTAAAIVMMTVFFKVNTISVEGAEKYSAEEITTALDINKGDNLYLWNKMKVEQHLMHKLPYIETVRIRRHLPDALVLTVTECRAAAAIKAEDGSFYYISSTGKILEQNASDGGLVVVTGLESATLTVGEEIEPKTDAAVSAYLAIMQVLTEQEMADELQFINLQELTDVRIGCGGRFDLRIGAVDSDLSYRVRFAQTVISDRLSPSDIGKLYWDDEGRMHFVPETAEEVARSGSVSGAADAMNGVARNPDGANGLTDSQKSQQTDTSADNTDSSGSDSSSDTSGDTSSDDTPSDDSSYDDSYDDSYYDDSYDDSYYDDSYDDSYYDDSYDASYDESYDSYGE